MFSKSFVKFAILKSLQIFYRASRWLRRGCVCSRRKKKKKIECSLLQNQFSRFRLILQRRINFALDIGANIRISYRLNQYTLDRLMGFSISFLAEWVRYGGTYKQLLRDLYVYGIRWNFSGCVSERGKAGTIMAIPPTSWMHDIPDEGKRMANVARNENGKIICPNAMPVPTHLGNLSRRCEAILHTNVCRIGNAPFLFVFLLSLFNLFLFVKFPVFNREAKKKNF